LRNHCRTEAASYKTPDRVELCAALPLTATGKLMRSELKQMAAKVPPRAKEKVSDRG
jgi:acyl-coenzyme A synthetase/AMP-(fatty) acid ligase